MDDQRPNNMTLLDSAIERLPIREGLGFSIMETWDDHTASLPELSRLVGTDPALSGRVLKLANSTARHQPPTACIPTAVARLGTQTVSRLAVAISLTSPLPAEPCPAFNRQQYWARCPLMAILAQGLGRLTGVAPPNDLFTCGLLARVGILGLASVYPEAYSRVLESDTDDRSALERETFGIDHNTLSETLMLNLRIPHSLAKPARYYEAPDQSTYQAHSRQQDLVALLHLAHHLSGETVNGRETLRRSAAVIDTFRRRMGIAEGGIEAVYQDAVMQWREGVTHLMQADPRGRTPSAHNSDVPVANCDKGRSMPESTPRLSAALVAEEAISRPLSATLNRISVNHRHCSKPSEAIQGVMSGEVNALFISMIDRHLIDLIRGTAAGDAIHVVTVMPSTRPPDPDFESQAYRAGANDVISTGICPEQLEARLYPARRRLACHVRTRQDLHDLQKVTRMLSLSHYQNERLALTDPLTDLPNRRAGQAHLERVWQSSLRNATPCAALAMDIDRFKTINDHKGHAIGDQVLRELAAVLKGAIRGEEIIARMGGEEFLMISDNLSLGKAVMAGERLRRHIEAAGFITDNGGLSITVSIGIAVRETTMRHSAEMAAAADRALYAAKRAGRNQIAVANGSQLRISKQGITGPLGIPPL